jgi:hypothetical protein
MHSSLSLLVSGQAQHIFFFGFESVAGAAADDPLFTAGISGDGTRTGTSVLPIFSSEAYLKNQAEKRHLCAPPLASYFQSIQVESITIIKRGKKQQLIDLKL